MGLGLDVCGVHSACSVYEAFGWVVFVAFRAIVAFMGRWGWTFVACTVFLLFMECLGWTFVVFMRRSGWSFLFICIFFCGVAWRSV